MNHSDCGFFKLMYTWVLPDNKKKFKIFARAYSKYFQRIYFFKSKKGTFKSLRMFSIYGFYGILGFKKTVFSDFHGSRFGFDDSVGIQIAQAFSNTRFLGFESDSKFFFADSRISTSLFIYL